MVFESAIPPPSKPEELSAIVQKLMIGLGLHSPVTKIPPPQLSAMLFENTEFVAVTQLRSMRIPPPLPS
jgi:hypothetical protein